MKPTELAQRLQSLADAAAVAFRDEVGEIMVKAAAEGSLHSGGTIKKWARAGETRARALTVAVLNDFEAAKRQDRDPELLALAHGVAIGFAGSLMTRCPLDRVNPSDGGLVAAERLFGAVTATVTEMTDRHAAGLPVEGVTRRDAPPGRALLAPYEQWVKTNPALSSLITFALGFSVAIAGVLLRLVVG